ncbi:alpha-N-acetylgalactosaminide alpha-2,6-sialyltransferase 2 [Clinocottus analis]|uniref:alpha-N-acetylgalactosaminide alpha-2,6-sialyltransferase 2 n=1 Tax=Clinocottus analis TaxID=304258 RepID=UPI0035C14B61
MALRRRLALCVLSGGLLLCVYMLRVSLVEPPAPLQHGGRFTPAASSRDQRAGRPAASSGPGQHQRAPAATAGPQTSTAMRDNAAQVNHEASQSSSRSDGANRTSTRTGTKAPVALEQLMRAGGPTEPPFIGDSYTSEDVPPQTNCPDGIASRVTNTEFGGRFLSRVPLLQRAGLATPEEHRRLSHYAGAHGWGGVAYETLVDSLSVLNSSANLRLLDDWRQRGNDSACIRCAVVGNGGILKASGRGEEIDGHHYVFRTNGAVIEGFERDVGTRTTHYTFSTNTLMNSMRNYAGVGYSGPPRSEETRYVFLPDHDRDYLLMKAAATHTAVERGPERAKDPSKYFGADVSAEKLKMYHPDFIRYLRNRFLRSKALKTKYKEIYRPSTGAVMLLAALHACDQVSAYGFMTPDYRKYSDHYYDSSYRPVGFFINHDLLLEMSLWQQLQRAGLLRLYTRP